MQKDKVKWGIIGCGDVAEIKSGPAFNKVAQSQLVAVMRRDGAKAKDFARRHKVEQWTDNADTIFQNQEINAVYIATPPSSHLEYALRAIESGKDVYLEKPVARNLTEAQEIKKALEGKSNKLVVAHYRRKMAAFLKVKKLLGAQAIGEVRMVDMEILQPNATDMITVTEDNWRINPEISGGGYFYDLAPHQLDLMIAWFGKPEKITGFSGNQQQIYPANDMVNGIMEFENGIQFRGVWAFNVAESDKKDLCTIYGNKGSISFSLFGNKVNLATLDGLETFHFPVLPHVQQPMIAATVDHFLNEGENPCPIEDAVMGMEIMEAFAGP